MNCYIREIIIFNENGERRSVPLSKGVNIITGDSQTGKSALIEIVDYCLCSANSSIPSGIISDFGKLYCIIIAFENKYLVIGRKKFDKGGNLNLYLKLETNIQSIENIQLDYFKDLQEIKIKNGAQTEIEKHLGMAVTDMTEGFDTTRKGKASLRNMVPFLFQHQNLIANKHALFYRFEDFYKRKDTIDEFPVFAGWVNDEYYLLKRQLDEKRKELRQIEVASKKKKEAQKEIQKELWGYFKNYYSLIGKSLDENLNLEQLLNLRKELPIYDGKTFTSPDIQIRYNRLKTDREEKNQQLNELNKKINDLENSQKYANEYGSSLEFLGKRSQTTENIKEFTCPICGKQNNEINSKFQNLVESKTKLEHELRQVTTYSISYIREIEDLSIKRNNLKKEIRTLNNQIVDIEQTIEEIKRQKDLGSSVIYSKAKIDLMATQIEKEINLKDNDDADSIKGEIGILEQKLSKFNLLNKFKTAESFLNISMSEICNKLDFEESFKPANLWFELENFTFYHSDSKLGKISLNEMGSGANWLSCHLSLFLSLLHFFAKEQKSVIPSFLFLDQPSQVYFPRDFDIKRDENVKQVANIYVTIIDKIEEIKENCGFAPQVIITDHADNLDLGKYDFNSFVRKRWQNGQALI